MGCLFDCCEAIEMNELIIKPKNSKSIFYLLVSCVFIYGGILMVADDNLLGYFPIIFFGLCFLIFVCQLIPGCTELKLSKNGFTTTTLFRSHFTSWDVVESFNCGYLGANKTIYFDFIDEHRQYELSKKISKKLTNSHAALPHLFGTDQTELLNTLNEWKSKYGIS